MKKSDNMEEAFENMAEVQGAEDMCCDNCFERMIFLLKDKDHEFSLGLETVLECLAFAIKTGKLPKLPSSWMREIRSIYSSEFAFDEDLCYHVCDKKFLK